MSDYERMNDMKEFDFGNAIVRIHEGSLSEEQRKEVLTNAATQFFRAIQKARNVASGADRDACKQA